MKNPGGYGSIRIMPDALGSHIQLAVFDLDGTLVHLELDHFADRITLHLLNYGLIPPPKNELLNLMHTHNLDALFTDPQQKKEFWSSYEDGETPPPRVFERSLYALEEMAHRGLRVAIATARTAHHDEMRERLRNTGILKHVQVLSTFHNSKWTNKVEQLQLLCSKMRIHPEHSMMVGDSHDDMKSARVVGFRLRLAIDNGLAWRDLVLAESPDRLLACVGEVPAALDEYHAERSQETRKL